MRGSIRRVPTLMGNSLQEQLLKAGLVSEQQLERANKPARPPRAKGQGKRRKRAMGPKGSIKGNNGKPAQPAAPPGPTLEELNAKIRGLLDTHRQNAEDAEVPYNFARENRIKKLYVTEEQREKLLAGELAIAGYRRVHHIIPTGIADEIQGIREEIFVHRASDGVVPPNSEASPGDEEANGEHDIPDDLVW